MMETRECVKDPRTRLAQVDSAPVGLSELAMKTPIFCKVDMSGWGYVHGPRGLEKTGPREDERHRPMALSQRELHPYGAGAALFAVPAHRRA